MIDDFLLHKLVREGKLRVVTYERNDADALRHSGAPWHEDVLIRIEGRLTHEDAVKLGVASGNEQEYLHSGT